MKMITTPGYPLGCQHHAHYNQEEVRNEYSYESNEDLKVQTQLRKYQDN